jgi:N-acetylmuramoyl-L-alanine amidase
MVRLISDDTWAALTIWQEARGEPHEGRVAVAEVIRNRMARHYQSDGTVTGTVLRPYQFSGWNTTDPNRRLAAVLDDSDLVVLACREAWRSAVAGSTFAKGAVFYLNPETMATLPPWVDLCHEVAIIGKHHFYATGAR